MTYKICFWNEKLGIQEERDATPEESAEIDARKAAPPPPPPPPTLKEFLVTKNVITKAEADTLK